MSSAEHVHSASRRTLLAGFAAVPVTGITGDLLSSDTEPSTNPAKHPDATLLDLGRELESAWATESAFDAAHAHH
jgi:hypothetical protein